MWQKKDNTIVREFEFKDFKSALQFVNKIGSAAEKMNHHPMIALMWGRVKVVLTTHSEGKVTAKDKTLAKEIDKLYGAKKTS